MSRLTVCLKPNLRIRGILSGSALTVCLSAALVGCAPAEEPEPEAPAPMTRTAINPQQWGLAFEMNQAEITEGARRTLHFSGQVATVSNPEAEMGLDVVSPGDMRGQIAAALANIDDVLEEAEMSRSDVVHLRFFVTDMDAYLANYDVYADWIKAAGIRPPQSLIGVSRLFAPELMVEIEATAAQ